MDQGADAARGLLTFGMNIDFPNLAALVNGMELDELRGATIAAIGYVCGLFLGFGFRVEDLHLENLTAALEGRKWP